MDSFAYHAKATWVGVDGVGHDLVFRAPELVTTVISCHMRGEDASRLSTYDATDAVTGGVVGVECVCTPNADAKGTDMRGQKVCQEEGECEDHVELM